MIFYTAITDATEGVPTFEAYLPGARYLCFTDVMESIPPPWVRVPLPTYFKNPEFTRAFVAVNAAQLFPGESLASWVGPMLRGVGPDINSARQILGNSCLAFQRGSGDAPEVWSGEFDFVSRQIASTGASGLARVSLGEVPRLIAFHDLSNPHLTKLEAGWWSALATFEAHDGVGEVPPASIQPCLPRLPPAYPSETVRLPEQWSSATLRLLQQLNASVIASGERLEGNYCHFDGASLSAHTPPDPRRSWKREFLRSAVTGRRRILEVGFNAGHSSALMLENPAVEKLLAIDLGRHAYSRTCAHLLAEAYPGRFDVKWGSSLEVLPAIKSRTAREFDLVHIDGGHEEAVFAADLAWFLANAQPGCALMVDDSYVPYIKRRLETVCATGHLAPLDIGTPSSLENTCFVLQRPLLSSVSWWKRALARLRR